MNRRQQQGFTLIELMIVVAIIGILAAVAVPQYQDYTIRSQVSEGLNMTSEMKAAISDFYSARGRFPTAAISAGLALNAASYEGNYVSGIAVVPNGGINVTYGNRVNDTIDGGVLSVRAALNDAGGIVWICGRGDETPGTNVTAPTATQATTLDARYLPTDCRL